MVAITTSPAHHLPAPRRSTAPVDAPRGLRIVADRPITPPWSRLGGIAVTAVLAVVVALALGYLATSAPTTPGTGSSPALADHVVAEGETMWSIAQDVAPAGEGASYVERLVAANGGATVAPGQVLTVPAP